MAPAPPVTQVPRQLLAISLLKYIKRPCLTAGVKYTVGVTRRAPDTFSLWLNGSRVDAVARRLNDGGLLVQVRSPALLPSPSSPAVAQRCSRINVAPGPVFLLLAHKEVKALPLESVLGRQRCTGTGDGALPAGRHWHRSRCQEISEALALEPVPCMGRVGTGVIAR